MKVYTQVFVTLFIVTKNQKQHMTFNGWMVKAFNSMQQSLFINKEWSIDTYKDVTDVKGIIPK